MSEQSDFCSIHCQLEFLPRSLAMKALWAILGVALTLIGSSVTYALTSSAQVSKLQVMTDQNAEDIREIKGMQARIDDKLDIILGSVQDNGKIIKGMLSVTP